MISAMPRQNPDADQNNGGAINASDAERFRSKKSCLIFIFVKDFKETLNNSM
jgi:hypothetical protein